MMLEDIEDLKAGAYKMLQAIGWVNYIQPLTWERFIKSNIETAFGWEEPLLFYSSGIQMRGRPQMIKVRLFRCLFSCSFLHHLEQVWIPYCTTPVNNTNECKVQCDQATFKHEEVKFVEENEIPLNRRNVIPSFLPSSHPWGLPAFLSPFSFLSSRKSPAATMLHVNSGILSTCWSHVLLLPGHRWSGKIKGIYMWRCALAGTWLIFRTSQTWEENLNKMCFQEQYPFQTGICGVVLKLYSNFRYFPQIPLILIYWEQKTEYTGKKDSYSCLNNVRQTWLGIQNTGQAFQNTLFSLISKWNF